MAPRLVAATLQTLRDRRFRRVPALRVTGERSALAFVESVGFCSTFHRFTDGVPCLWEAVVGRRDPRWPRRSHHDRGIGLTWDLKDRLPSSQRVYYGKLLGGRPLLVALDAFPAFYALIRGRQRARDYRAEYDAGRMSHTARLIMDALARERPQYTRGLRASCFMLEPRRTREFERAMAELQQGLWIVKTEERYEPTFSYRWDLLERWLPDAVAAGRTLSRASAIASLVERYVCAAVFTSERALVRLLRVGGAREPVSHDEIAAAVARLATRGVLLAGQHVEGWSGAWIVDAAVARRPARASRHG